MTPVELMKKNTKIVNRSNENDMPNYISKPTKGMFSKEY